MLLDAILTVLRETLEAGVLVSLLAAVSRGCGLPRRWFVLALPLGIGLAVLYAANLALISNWFDGVGQELLNSLLQYLICISLLLLLTLLARRERTRPGALRACMTVAVICAVTREGAEILLFFSTYLQAEEALVRALTSGFVGLAVGLSVGVLTFIGLLTLPPAWRRRVQALLLSLVCAGMALQATQLLIQADWISTGMPLWNSSGLLSENAMLGQMAYAVFGYEATPTAPEIIAYATVLALLACVHLRPRLSARQNAR